MVKTIDIKNDMATSSKPYKKLFSKTYLNISDVAKVKLQT